MGETGRTLHQRMTEHKRVVRNSDPNNALAVHVSKSHHNIIWEEAKVVAREQHWTKRKIKEGLIIRDRVNNLNLDQGFQLDTNWLTSTIGSDCSYCPHYISSCCHHPYQHLYRFISALFGHLAASIVVYLSL